jgi:hypothetical protein
MTVNNVDNTISYIANGSTTEWIFNFPAVDASFIEVFIVDAVGNQVQLPLSTYTVTLNPLIGSNPTSQGGKVLFPLVGAPLANGSKLTIVRNLPAEQNVSIANQSVIYPPIIEQEFDYLTLLSTRGSQDISRAFKVGFGDPIPALVPPVAQRAGHGTFFDSAGNLVPGEVPSGGVFVSAAMIPVVEAATLALARQAMGISPDPFNVTGTFIVTPINDRQVMNLEGDFYTVSLGDHAGFLPSFWTFIYNTSTRGKAISLTGFPTFMLWPGQFVWVFNTTAGWAPTNPGRWTPRVEVNFFVHPTQGNDANDGLATGTGAFQTIAKAISVVENDCDGEFTINLADGTHSVGAGIICSKAVPGSADGYNIIGNIGTPNNVVISATGSGQFCWVITNNAVVTLRGFRFFSVNGGGLQVKLGAVATIGNVIFGQVSPNNNFGYHMECRSNGTLNVDAPYTMVGVCAHHINCVSGGTIIYTPGTVTIGNALNVDFFIVAAALGIMHSRGQVQTFVNPGFVTGISYSISSNSCVLIAGSVIPGSPGSTSTGGLVG